jgi:hypothetical protein
MAITTLENRGSMVSENKVFRRFVDDIERKCARNRCGVEFALTHPILIRAR